MRPVEIALFIGLAVLILLAVLLLLRIHALRRDQTGLPALLIQDMEARHRAVLTDLHTGLAQQSDRMQGQLAALQIAQTSGWRKRVPPSPASSASSRAPCWKS
jgi:DNA recombination protein RmuC